MGDAKKTLLGLVGQSAYIAYHRELRAAPMWNWCANYLANVKFGTEFCIEYSIMCKF